jgi:hypothetical protein
MPKLTTIRPEQLYHLTKRLQKRYGGVYGSLSNDETLALQQYKGVLYTIMNEMLMGNTMKVYVREYMISDDTDTTLTKEEKKQYVLDNAYRNIVVLDTIFQRLPYYTFWNIPLYRGIGDMNDEKSLHYKVGKQITFPAYTSTSLDPSVGIRFQDCGEHPCCLLVLYVKHRIPIVPMDAFYKPRFNTEHELLLPRQTRWTVRRKYTARIPDWNTRCDYDRIGRKITVYELESTPYRHPSAFPPSD